MTRFPGKRSSKGVSSGLYVLASFAIIISLGGSMETALAADDPSAAAAKSSQIDSLDIPGSFKDLPAARDTVTAKRSSDEVGSLTPTGSVSSQLVIDADKVARTGGAEFHADKVAPTGAIVYAESELVDFHATAYCLKGRTASGINTRPGVIAADPSVLPLGTVVHLRAGAYTGTYTVMDTGGRIKGRRVDVYVPTHKEAREFGRRQVKIKVIGRNSTNKSNKNLLASDL